MCFIKASSPTMLQSNYDWIHSHLLTDAQATSMSTCKEFSDHHSSLPEGRKCLLLLRR